MKVDMKLRTVLGGCVIALAVTSEAYGREFVHPGLSYTADDLVRMRELVATGTEPAASTFKALQESGYSQLTNGEFDDVTAIAEGKHNNTIGVDGRKAHDLALLYRLTDDSRYADEALKHINRYNCLTNVSIRGTGPLDAGKIYLLLEAAELLRDYDGWSTADREAFMSMLVYPGYSNTAYPAEHANMDDALNDVTFYWNIYNLDPTRWGNQGLFAARGLMAMAIFLDNEVMYDRVMNYLMAKGAPEGDLPFHQGTIVRGRETDSTDYMTTYAFSWASGTDEFISDAALPYYIYTNGQCQEACRDQGHVMAGLGQLVDLAEMAHNQGDDLYGAFNNRILTGLEWALRYNLSAIQGAPWEPDGFSYREESCTFDNGVFYRADSRSQRWSAKMPFDGDRETSLGNVRYLQQALAHYRDRVKLAPETYEWLEKACDYQLGLSGIEDWGSNGHHYEWKGWGTLTKMIVEPQSRSDVIENDNAAGDDEVFDLWGRKTYAGARGITIVGGKKMLNR